MRSTWSPEMSRFDTPFTSGEAARQRDGREAKTGCADPHTTLCPEVDRVAPEGDAVICLAVERFEIGIREH